MFDIKTAQTGNKKAGSDKEVNAFSLAQLMEKKEKAVFLQVFANKVLNPKLLKPLGEYGYVEEDNREAYKRFLLDRNGRESMKLPEMKDAFVQMMGGYIELILAGRKYGYCVRIRDGDREYRQQKAEWFRIAHIMVQTETDTGQPGILSLEIERDLTRHITKKLQNGFRSVHDAIEGFVLHKNKHSDWEFSTSGSSSVWRSNDGRVIQWNGNREDPKVLELKWVSYRFESLPGACNKMIEQVETFVEKSG